ncbi:MAG: ABC transporter substrate-binding protein, partial [Desulfobulbaceae bacterium]|nr:ABC transporter substrate-binding protein [Desulfobulbaceae bacterium]
SQMKKLFIFLFITVVTGMSLGNAHAKAPIRIGYLQNDIHQLACWIAIEKGFYKKYGADVEVAGIFRAGPEEMSAFAAGALDMGYVGEAPATTAVANGVAQVTVMAQVNTEGSAIIVGKDNPEREVKDLIGKRITIPGHSTVQDFLLQKALRKFKVDPKKVSIIVLKPPEMIGALKTGQVDAFIAWEPYPAKAQTMGVGQVLLTSGKIWKDHPCCVLVADNRFLAERPEDVTAMVRAHVEATDFINAFPDEAVKIGVRYTGMDEKTVRLAMDNVKYTYVLSIEGEKEYVDFLSHLKYIKVPDVNAFTVKFINQETLQEITGK